MLQAQPSLQEERARLHSAEAKLDEARARLLPRVEVEAFTSYGLLRPVYERDYPRVAHRLFAAHSFAPAGAVDVSSTLSVRDWIERRSSAVGVKAARSTLNMRQDALVTNLSLAILQVVTSERLAERSEIGLRAARERVQLVQRMFELGRSSALDVSRMRQDELEAQSAALLANESILAAREVLGAAVGSTDAVGIAPSFDLHAFEQRRGTLPGCQPIRDVAERPEVVAAYNREQQASVALEAARAAYLPVLEVSLSYGARYNEVAAPVLPEPQPILHRWTAMVGITWRLWDGGLRAAAESVSTAAVGIAKAQRRAVELEVARRRGSLRRAVELAESKLELAHHDRDTARHADELAQGAYELGRLSVLDLVDTARRLRAAESVITLEELTLLQTQLEQQLFMARCS
jgi:outer membrane protein TolC